MTWIPLIGLSGIFLVLLFPDGRPPRGPWRIVTVLEGDTNGIFGLLVYWLVILAALMIYSFVPFRVIARQQNDQPPGQQTTQQATATQPASRVSAPSTSRRSRSTLKFTRRGPT